MPQFLSATLGNRRMKEYGENDSNLELDRMSRISKNPSQCNSMNR